MKEIIITSTALILCVMLIRHFFKGKISSRLQYALWLLVAVRLMIPVSAQIYVSLGAIDQFRVMELAERLEEKIGDITGQLDQPVAFTLNMNSPVGSRVAEYILGEDILGPGTADGPTSVFLAGRIGTWLDILRGIWFGGMGIAAVWMVAVNLRFGRKLHKNRREYLVPEEVQNRLHKKLSGNQRIRVYTAKHLVSPCLYGLPGREAVYLPEAVTEDETKLRHILTHEICHKRHGDSLWSILRSVLLACYWFHPLVWAAAVLSKRDCELACDESALILLGEEERIGYGKTLLSIIAGKGGLSDFACTATTMTGSGKSIRERVYCIAGKPKVLSTAVTAVVVLIMAVSVLIFTNSPRFSGGIWDGGQVYVMTADKRILLPDTIAGISGYAGVQGKENDLIIYQTASDQEVGRFCTVTYKEAVDLVDAGRTVVPLGDYGRNIDLKQYMGMILHHDYTSAESAAGHSYNLLPDEEIITNDYTPEGVERETEHEYSVPERSGKDPFAFDGRTEWEYDRSNESAKKPFLFDGQSEWQNQEEPESITENPADGVLGTDSNTDDTTYVIEDTATYLPDEPSEDSVVYLPDEQITAISVNPYLTDCYLYVTADHSKVRDKYLEEMAYIDSELRNAAEGTIVTGINQEVTEETFEMLARHRTRYLGDNSAVLALVDTLPQPEGLSYQEIELHTGGEPENMALQIRYSLQDDNRYIDHDILYFNAVMLFASIENLEECIFRVEETEGDLVENVIYDREELTAQTGGEQLWTELEGEELLSWLKELHQRAITALNEKRS